MSEPQIVILDTAEALHVRAAEEIAHIAGEAICTDGEFSLCLTGGTTPKHTYELLASRFDHSIDWSEVHFYWGDERCVPPADEASNFGMADKAMLSRLQLRPDQIHRIRGEDAPQAAARAYENDLRQCFKLSVGQMPSFSLVLLGLGDNAHIASLFPHSQAIHVNDRLAIAVEVDAPQRYRISLTAPVLNNATRIMFMVTGEGKAEAIKNVLKGPRDVDSYPAQLITPTHGAVTWLLDRDAAKLL